MFPEKMVTPWRFMMSRTLKRGSPILIPRAFASLERAMIQPSLFERTTTGRTEREIRKSSSFFVIPFAQGVAPVAARQTYLRLRCGEELLRNRKHYADCQKS
jgi:hypothetical protein